MVREDFREEETIVLAEILGSFVLFVCLRVGLRVEVDIWLFLEARGIFNCCLEIAFFVPRSVFSLMAATG